MHEEDQEYDPQPVEEFDFSETERQESVQEESFDDFMDDLDLPDIPLPAEEPVSKEVEDECAGAFKFAFVGVGQGGSRIAESFWNLGYRRVCVANTTNQDLKSINLPDANKLIMDIGTGGAGKEPSRGNTAAKQYREDLYDLMKKSFGEGFDRIMVCVGAGGGTGSGSVSVAISVAHDLAKQFKLEGEGKPPAVGVICSMPKESESARVNANAHGVLNGLFDMVGSGRGKLEGRTISPLILVDNQRIESMYPNLPVTKFWDVANKSISGTFHLFNSIASKDSDITTFDKADFKDILDAGCVSFGACPIRKWDEEMDISRAIRNNLNNNVLVGGFDMQSAKTSGCIFIGHRDVLDNLPQNYLEHGFQMLIRMMRSGGTLHRGIYKSGKQGLVVYSIMGELSRPEKRLGEIQDIARGK